MEPKKGASVGWEYQQTSYRAVCVDVERLSEEQTEAGFPAQVILNFRWMKEIIRIKVHQISPDDRKTCQFEYQFDYQKLPKINAYAAAWLTVEGMRRIEYLPVGVKYRLVEEQPRKDIRNLRTSGSPLKRREMSSSTALRISRGNCGSISGKARRKSSSQVRCWCYIRRTNRGTFDPSRNFWWSGGSVVRMDVFRN